MKTNDNNKHNTRDDDDDDDDDDEDDDFRSTIIIVKLIECKSSTSNPDVSPGSRPSLPSAGVSQVPPGREAKLLVVWRI